MTEIGVEIMFESEIEQLKKHLAAKLPQPQPFVYLHDILTSVIEDCYKHSIQADVDWWIYEEQLERAEHPHFDTTAPELQEMFAALDDAYRQYARFNNSQFNEAIESAVKVRLNFLCRPRTTLKWFVFRGAPTKTVYEIVLRLSYFSDYHYLTTGFHQWAQKTYTMHPSMDLLSVVEFEKLMETIDNDFILDLSPHQFVDMLIPLFEFFHLDKEFTPQLTIPTEALIVFLDDKGVELIAHEIERLLYNEDMEQISQERFLDIVTDIINQIEEQESLTSSSENTDEAITDEAITDEVITDEAITDEYITSENTSEAALRVHTPENIAEEAGEEYSDDEVPEAQQNEAVPEIVETVEEMMIETSKIQNEIEPEIPDIAEDILNEEIKIHDEMPTESSVFEYLNNEYSREGKISDEEGRLEEHSIETIEKSVEIPIETIENYETAEYETEEYETEEYETEEYETEEYNSNEVESIQEETPVEVSVYEESAVEITTEPDIVSTDAVQEISLQEAVIEDEIILEIHEETSSETFSINSDKYKENIDIQEEVLPENIEIHGEVPVEIDKHHEGTPSEVFETGQYHSTELRAESDKQYEPVTPETAEVMEEYSIRPLSVEVDTSNEAIMFHDGVFNQTITTAKRYEEFPAAKSDIQEVNTPEIPKQTAPSLQTYIDTKQREEFIKKLCAKDEQMFLQLVEDIDNCDAWREAAQIIDRFFIRHKIDHRSAAAVSFRTIVQKRYSGI